MVIYLTISYLKMYMHEFIKINVIFRPPSNNHTLQYYDSINIFLQQNQYNLHCLHSKAAEVQSTSQQSF